MLLSKKVRKLCLYQVPIETNKCLQSYERNLDTNVVTETLWKSIKNEVHIVKQAFYIATSLTGVGGR